MIDIEYNFLSIHLYSTLVAPSLTEWMATPSQTQARRQDITLADTSDQTYPENSFETQGDINIISIKRKK